MRYNARSREHEEGEAPTLSGDEAVRMEDFLFFLLPR